MDWQEACTLEQLHGDKARAALRRYRQGCCDSDAKARAIHRLKRTRTWAAISTIGAARAVTPEAAPTAIQCRKRTPAHERAIRRAWSERKAARAARFNVLLARDMAANNRRAAEFQRERADALAERVDALEYQSQQDRDAKRAADDACVTYRQRQGEAEDAQRLAEQEAREALAAREDMKRMLADAEARAAAAEAENAQLWAEIETLTAPVPALAA